VKSMCFAVLLCIAALAPARAQSSSPGLTGRLGPSAVVRVTLPDGRTLTGRYALVGHDRIAVLAESGIGDTVSVAGIRTLAVRGRHTRTGALVGGAAGVAAGIFFGYVIGAVCDAADCDRGRPYLLTIPLFGAGGTLLGAGIGAAIPKWKRVYP
jgi:hypothetical protein